MSKKVVFVGNGRNHPHAKLVDTLVDEAAPYNPTAPLILNPVSAPEPLFFEPSPHTYKAVKERNSFFNKRK